jgi:hypothetical protein
VNDAREQGLDALEDALFERGAEGDTTAAIFMLRGWARTSGGKPKTVNRTQT